MMRSECVSCRFGDGYGATLLVKAAQYNTSPWGRNLGDTPWGHHVKDNTLRTRRLRGNRLIKNKKVSKELIISLIRNVDQVNLLY
jgi:hypothetical protein